MTIRDLIKMGANLDDEIFIEAHTYDDDGNRIGTYFSYTEINSDDCTFEKGQIVINASVTNVI